MLGLTFAFMQGRSTDMGATAAFMKDIKAFGYARMSIINYKKSGQAFSATITVRPIFDCICSVGVDANVPVLTHFATTMSDLMQLKEGCPLPAPRTENLFSNDADYFRRERQTRPVNGITTSQRSRSPGRDCGFECVESSVRPGGESSMAIASGSHSDSTRVERDGNHSSRMHYDASECGEALDGQHVTLMSYEPSTTYEGTDPSGMLTDARARSKKLTTASVMSAQDFIKYATHVRLSDLCRLMVACNNAIVLTDARGAILHASAPWVALTGYTVSEAEGFTCSFLQGPATDSVQAARCMGAVRAGHMGQMEVVNYKKDGSPFKTHVIIQPMRGAYLSSGALLTVAVLSITQRFLSIRLLTSPLPPNTKPPPSLQKFRITLPCSSRHSELAEAK